MVNIVRCIHGWIICVTSAIFIYSVEAQQCDKIDSCSCKIVQSNAPHGPQEDQYIDLHPLDGDGTARFTDQQGLQASTVYSWNPCSPFTEGDCSDVAACQIQQLVPDYKYFSLGSQDSSKFVYDTTSQGFSIEYSQNSILSNDTGPNTLRTAIVILQCDQSQEGSLTNVGEQTTGFYYMTLTSKYACPSATPPNPPSSKVGLSVGSVLCIVFFVGVVLYLAGGITYQAAVRKARGAEVIPNRSFWTSLPGLVKDGAMLVVSKTARPGYSKI